MSASRERKKRMEQGQQPVPAQVKKKKKLSEGAILAICVVLIVALVFGGMFAYRTVVRNQTVLTVGEHEVSVKEFNLFYNSTASGLQSYASILGITTGVALDEQYVTANGLMYMGLLGLDSSYLSDATTDDDGTFNVTWAQVIAYNAMKSAVQTYAVYDEAVAAGYQLDAEALEEIETEVSTLAMYATIYGTTIDDYLEDIYGAGCDEALYRSYLTAAHTAEHYLSSLEYTAEEISARYDESPEKFDVATYYSYTVKASDFAETKEDGTTADVTDENRASAKEAAEAMEKAFAQEDERVSLRADHTQETAKSVCGEDGAAWLFGTAKPGDVKMFQNEDTYYVLKLVANENYDSLNVIELVVAADDEEEHDHEEGEEVDHLHAEEKVTAVTDALKSDASEEKFKELVKEYSDQSGDAVIENMTRSTMASVSADMLDWSMESRKAGDYRVFETDSGTIILYFTGYGKTYRDLSVSATLVSEWFEKVTDAAEEVCGYDEDAAMHGNVDLAFTATSSSY